MGRTLVVRAFLFAALFLSGLISQPAKATETGPDGTVTLGIIDELESWLAQLCLVIQCDLERSEKGGGQVSQADRAAVHFVLAYEAYGVRQDLTPLEREYGRSVTALTQHYLAINTGKLQPDVERALWATLDSMRIELEN